MKFAPFILTALAVVATTSAAEVGAPARRAAVELEARQCPASPACTCTGPSRVFCGDESLLPGCLNGYAYQCNGSTGRTCSYGAESTCNHCGNQLLLARNVLI